MDAQTLRRVLHDFFKFNPKDFVVKGSGTGFLVSSNHKISIDPIKTIKVGFAWYKSAYTGEGTPPPDQGLKIRFRRSLVNENLVPENMASEFTLIPGTTDNPKVNYVRLTTTQNAEGTPTLAVIDITVDGILDDPPGSLDVAPATSSRALWILTTDEKSIVDESALYIGGVSVLPKLFRTQCGESLVKMDWGHGLL